VLLPNNFIKAQWAIFTRRNNKILHWPQDRLGVLKMEQPSDIFSPQIP
jgi:hypothetical protein